MLGSDSGLLMILSIVISFFLVLVTYSQYRIQSREFRPDLTIPRVAHYATVADDREMKVEQSDIKNDEILFEVTNLGSGTATQVRAESKLWVIQQGADNTDEENDGRGMNTSNSADTGDQNDHKNRCVPDDSQESHADNPVVTLSEFERPRSLTLDVAREDVYHSDWTETMEATIPGDQSNIGYITRLHVQAEDRSLSLDEVLTHEFPEKSALRVKVQLVYSGPIEFRDRFSGVIDSVIFPGISANLEEAMAAEIPYSRYERRSHTEALLDAKTDVEHHRQSDQGSDD